MFKKIYYEGQETNYSVSENGEVKNDKTNKIMKGTYARNEYHSVQLSINKKVKTFMVHRLVAEYFVHNPDPEINTIVDHIDQNKLNNKASNLRWTTTKENILNCDRISRNTKRTKADLDKQWKPLLGLDGYSINIDGELKNDTNNYILQGTVRNGYNRHKIMGKTLSAHRLVWEAFNGEIPEGKVIDHIDGNRLNNCLSNLRLVSQSDNMFNAQQLGHKGQVKVSQYDKEGNFIATYNSFREAANSIGGNEVAIKSASDRLGMSKGYFWTRHDSNKTIEEVLKETTSNKPKSTSIGVSQYDADGKLIQHFNSIKEAARVIGCSDSTIKRAADNHRIGKSYYWILDNQDITIEKIISST